MLETSLLRIWAGKVCSCFARRPLCLPGHQRTNADADCQSECHAVEESENSQFAGWAREGWIRTNPALTEEYDHKLTELEAELAELKRELLGPKSDRLTPEQQEQLDALNQDLEADTQRQDAASDGVLDEDEEDEKQKKRTGKRRGGRHPLPAHIETETITIEPDLAPCPCCGNLPEPIGEEVTEEIDFIPAKLIRRRIVRPKYAYRCGEAGVAIAPLPPRLVPQSRLGLGLAVHMVLARYDDHLSGADSARGLKQLSIERFL